MAAIKIQITEYFFKDSEILILKNPALDNDFILDVDKILDSEEILLCVRFYTELGDRGGMIRNRVYTPWHNLPISSDDALDACKWSKRVSRRTYTKIDNPDPTNPTIVRR